MKAIKIIVFILLASAIALLSNMIAVAWVDSSGSAIEKVSYIADNITDIIMRHELKTDKPYLVTTAYIIGAVGLMAAIVYVSRPKHKKMRDGKEYGSAEWGTREQSEHYADTKNPENNIILSQSDYLRLDRNPDYNYDKNNNVIVIGGSGAGKTRSIVKPNLMQLYGSYVVSDTKEIPKDTARMFEKNGYKIKILNLKDPRKSMRYNPFKYIRNESDIISLSENILLNTNNGVKQSDFWEQVVRLWLQSHIGYLWYEAPENEQNLPMLSDMINCEIAWAGSKNKSPIDELFEELEAKDPRCFAVKQYKKLQIRCAETRDNIFISVAARLAMFDVSDVAELLMYDEFDFDSIGFEKTIVYVLTSDTDDSLHFISNIFYKQLFEVLVRKADEQIDIKLPIPVQFILDEFANGGIIPKYHKLIGTFRERGIGAIMLLQGLSQMKNIYKDTWETIISCCDTLVFLGSNEQSILKKVEEDMDKETIDIVNESKHFGKDRSTNTNDSKAGRNLMSVGELRRLKKDECIVLINGALPFKSKKYNMKKHKRYKELADGNAANLYINNLNQPAEKDISDIENVDFMELQVDEKNLI